MIKLTSVGENSRQLLNKLKGLWLSPHLTSRERNALRASIIWFIANIQSLPGYIALFWVSNTWQTAGLTLLTFLSAIFMTIAVRAALQKNVVKAISVTIISLVVIVSYGTITFANVASIAALSCVLLGIAISTQSLSQRGINITIIVCIFIALLLITIDVFGLPTQLEFPLLEKLQVIVGPLLLLVYVIYLTTQFQSFTLPTKLILTFLVVSLLPLGGLIFLNTRSTITLLREQANESLLTGAIQTSDDIGTFINNTSRSFEVEAKSFDFVQYLNAPSQSVNFELNTILQNLSQKSNYQVSYALLNKDGVNIGDSLESNITTSESGQLYFQQPLETNTGYATLTQDKSTSEYTGLVFSTPIQQKNGENIGVLRAKYDINILQDLITHNSNLAGQESFGILLDSEGQQIVGKEVDLPADFTQNIADIAANTFFSIENLSLSSEDIQDEEANLGNNQLAIAKLETQPWFAVYFQAEEVFLAPLETQNRVSSLGAVLLAGLVAAAAIVLGQFLAGPILRLTSVAKTVSEGNLEARAEVESEDETGQLAEAFNAMTGRLRDLIGGLEDEVRERTEELALSVEVGQRASVLRELEELLPTISNFIKERFNIDYVQFYLLDDLGKRLVLRSGTGEVGEILLGRKHSLPVGSGSIVGRVISEGHSILVSDTEKSDIHKPNPLLPNTRSEMAILLKVEDRPIGVLDVQDDKVNTFNEENLQIFEVAATQLAIAIDSALHFEESALIQKKAEEAIRQFTRENWVERLSTEKESLNFIYDLSTIKRLSKDEEVEVEPSHDLVVPIKVQNQQIGQLVIQSPSDKVWDEDERMLVLRVAQQLAQKAETLRLFEKSQQVADRERLARQIVDHIRASRDIESALKTASQELTRVLGTAKAVVELNISTNEENKQHSSNGH